MVRRSLRRATLGACGNRGTERAHNSRFLSGPVSYKCVDVSMKTGNLTPSVSRMAGGLFYSVRRLTQSLNDIPEMEIVVFGNKDKFTSEDIAEWSGIRVRTNRVVGLDVFGFSPQLVRSMID